LDLERIVADLKQERDRLNRAIAELEGVNSPRAAKKTSVAKRRPPALKGRKRGGLTPEGRRRLSLAMKKRWAERKKQGS
jgi:DNA-binding helix-hairpin-helix protein with protein kinase domain